MATQANVSTLLLRNVPLFAMLPEGHLALLTTVVRREAFARGASIIQAGSVTDSLYVVISGRLKVIIEDKSGRQVILTMLGPASISGKWCRLTTARGLRASLPWNPANSWCFRSVNFGNALQITSRWR